MKLANIMNGMRTHARSLATFGMMTLALNNCIPGAAELTAAAEDLAEAISGSVNGTRGKVTAADGSALSNAFVAISQADADSDTLNLGRKSGRGVLGLGRYGGRATRALSRVEGSAQNLVNEKGKFLRFETLADDEGETCEDISSGINGEVLATDCTDAQGDYDISSIELPCGTELTFTAKKGSFLLSINFTLTCQDSDEDGDYSDEIVEMETVVFDDDCGLGDDAEETDDEFAALTKKTKPAYSIADDGCHFEEANMAVVTGHYDEIQNVLAKLGFGETDGDGRFDATEDHDFTLIDGNDSLDDAEYTNVDDFLLDLEQMSEYDIIFMNCGPEDDTLSQDPEVLANLQQYVEEGGKLYVTDWSFNFVEDPFPSFIDFYNDEEDAETAEDHHSAKIGTGGITTDADLQDHDLADWLDHVEVNDGTIEEDCYGLPEENVNGRIGARNDDGTVTIGDFLGSWVVIDGEHDGYEGESKTWVSGVITSYEGVADKPLTMTKDVGEGRLLYSSYHTAHSCPTEGFWPQERILQYLVFEL